MQTTHGNSRANPNFITAHFFCSAHPLFGMGVSTPLIGARPPPSLKPKVRGYSSNPHQLYCRLTTCGWVYRVTAKLQSGPVFTITQYGDCDQTRFLSSLGSHKFFYGWDKHENNYKVDNKRLKDLS